MDFIVACLLITDDSYVTDARYKSYNKWLKITEQRKMSSFAIP